MAVDGQVRAAGFGAPPQPSWRSARRDRAGRAAVAGAIFDVDELAGILDEGRDSVTFSLDRSFRSPGEGRVAVVITLGESDDGRPVSVITQLGHVRRGRVSITVDFACRLSHLVALDPLIRLAELREHLTAHQYQAIRGAAATPRGDGLSPTVSAALRAYLEERLDPEVWRQIRRDSADLADNSGVVILQQQADALESALAFSGMDTRLIPPVAPARMSMLTDLVPQPSEPALIDRDLRNFPDMEGHPVREDVFVFTDGAHRLDVINLNATGAETATGVDLLYHHHNYGSLIAVQYKRVDAGARGDRLAAVDQ